MKIPQFICVAFPENNTLNIFYFHLKKLHSPTLEYIVYRNFIDFENSRSLFLSFFKYDFDTRKPIIIQEISAFINDNKLKALLDSSPDSISCNTFLYASSSAKNVFPCNVSTSLPHYNSTFIRSNYFLQI